MILLEDLGYTPEFTELRKANHFEHLDIGRVVAEHKERYIVQSTMGELDAEVIGNLRFTAQSRADFPAVGDWVAFALYDEQKAIIHGFLPRKSVIERRSVGKKSDTQIIAANIDVALIVQSADRDFNMNRLERYLAICYDARVQPWLIITKSDLLTEDELLKLKSVIGQRVGGLPVYIISNWSKDGLDTLAQSICKGKTYCLLGSSGVGKSSLLNNLSHGEPMKTGTISEHTNKGRHVTTHRELIVLKNGAIIIDNPGMREVGITDLSTGIEATFESILKLSESCRYTDCTHTSESGCAVIQALTDGELTPEVYENFMKMEREKAHFSSTLAEKRQKDKAFGKYVKNFKKQMKRRDGSILF